MRNVTAIGNGILGIAILVVVLLICGPAMLAWTLGVIHWILGIIWAGIKIGLIALIGFGVGTYLIHRR